MVLAVLSGLFETSLLHLTIEGVLLLTVVYLVFRMNRPNKDRSSHRLTEKQKDELIAEWVPDPLVPETPQDHHVLNPRFADGKMTKNVSIEGQTYLNMASSNFLSFIGESRIEERTKQTIFKYGVGSCGPRGFYGTVDVHLDLEAELAKFLHCEEAVLYSYGFATVSSAIPAYAKKGDIIFADEGVNFAIQKGLQASRSRVEFFKHNDMEDLERILKIQEEKDNKDPKKAAKIRRFLVVEGLYVNTADLCPLPKIIEFNGSTRSVCSSTKAGLLESLERQEERNEGALVVWRLFGILKSLTFPFKMKRGIECERKMIHR
ncbi:unnamed protein product [Caenorhabditis auriculariae]|uniref:Serine palmitoyltransferase 1 n=1 Tax=Caenorhabditis auriculariae TaxID=2777116 RepID=A0A8S1HJF9_9PELO|nr:unnamed protein product [Caenorhabditis auriculariae]